MSTSLAWLFKNPKRRFGTQFLKPIEMTLAFMEPRVLANCRLLEFYQTADDALVKKCAARDRQSFVFADESLRGDIIGGSPVLLRE